MNIVDERGKDYGDPGPRFEATEKMFFVWEDFLKLNHPNFRDDPALLRLHHVIHEICNKSTRLAVTPTHKDSFVDISGYADCGKMSL